VNLELVEAETPIDGRLQVFYSPQDIYSPFPILFDTAQPQSSYSIDGGIHLHANWLFTKAGLYRLTFRAVGTLLDGRTVQSPEQTLRIWVGELADLPVDYPSQVVLEASPGSGDGGSTRLAVGAFGSSWPSGTTVDWMKQCATYNSDPWGLQAWQVLGSAETWDLTDPRVEGQVCEYRARVVDQSGAVLGLTQAYWE
jgi:surface-anchored protein